MTDVDPLVARDLLGSLRCPECGDSFAFVPSAIQPLAGGSFGVLGCGRHEFPVVDSIPVLRTGRVGVQDHLSGRDEVVGPDIGELLARVRGLDPLGALVDLLAFPPSVPFGLEGVRVARLPLTRGPFAAAALRRRRGLVRRAVTAACWSAEDWMELCHARSRNVNPELYPYFLGRVGQPRYLASLSITSILPSAAKPVLDLACGFGHMMHHLSVRREPLDSVGVDRNFFQLWVARRYVASRCGYVCADATAGLPFADDTFSASICTDSFHLMPGPRRVLAELRRCTAGGTVILDRVGNGLLEPHDTESEPDPQGYLDLVSDGPHRMVGGTELIQGYLAGHGPQLAVQRPAAEFGREKWLTLVCSDDEGLFTDYGPFPQWPHGAGPLGLNPIYVAEPDGAGRVRLLFRFPSTWFAFENAGMLAYTSAGERVSRAEFDAMVAGRPVSRAEELVERFVLLGMPRGYARPLRVTG